jgi:hypothetical protein
MRGGIARHYSANGAFEYLDYLYLATPVTIIHSITSAPSRVATLHLIVYELPVFGGLVAIEVLGLRGGGARATNINDKWLNQYLWTTACGLQ